MPSNSRPDSLLSSVNQKSLHTLDGIARVLEDGLSPLPPSLAEPTVLSYKPGSEEHSQATIFPSFC